MNPELEAKAACWDKYVQWEEIGIGKALTDRYAAELDTLRYNLSLLERKKP